MWLLCGYYVISWLLCGYYVVTKWLLYGYYVVIRWLLCGGGVNLILPHSGSQKRQNWDEVK